MKKFMKVGFVLAAMAITLTSCDCFKKISKNVSDIRVSCTPTILTLKGDAVNATYTIEFPAKMFSKKAVVKITPVLVYEGGEIAGTPKYLQGEKVIQAMLDELAQWMKSKSFDKLAQFKGKMNAQAAGTINPFERTQFMKYYSNHEE